MRRAQWPKVKDVPRPEGWKPNLKGNESLGQFLRQTIFSKKPGDLVMSSLVLRKTIIRDRGEAKRYRPQKEDFASADVYSGPIDRNRRGFDNRALCRECNKITINRLLDAAHSDFTKVSEKVGGHHFNPHELEQSALSCPLCRLLVLAFGHDFYLLLKSTSPPTPPDTRGNCRFKIWARDMDTDAKKRGEGGNLQILVLEWIDGQSDFVAELMLFADKGSQATTKGKISTTLYSPKLSKNWLGRSLPVLLQQCHTQHPKCRGSPFSQAATSPYTTLSEKKLPSRVIVTDWEKHSRRGPFLLESRGTYGVYATLSHCWGDPDSMPKTTRSTLQDNMEYLGLDSSSARQRTICEAIDVCKVLKIPYLWVDAFCIIQHDPSDPESDLTDWEWEAQDMGRIYKDSALTISAAGASDDFSNGLYGNRLDKAQYVKVPFKMGVEKKRENRSALQKFNAKKRVQELDDTTSEEMEGSGSFQKVDADDIEDESGTESNHSEEDSDSDASGSMSSEPESDESFDDDLYVKDFFYVCLPPRSFDDEVTNSKLFTRGWVLQERLLSPRYLHFGKDQWFWQCRQWTVAEVRGFENGAITVGADLGFYPALFKDPIKFALWWTKVIETYSRLDFSVRSDRLIALTGLVTELWKATPQEYHHGLWSQKLYIQLLWGVSASARSNGKESQLDPAQTETTPTAPSWSWLSRPEPVTYGEKRDSYEPTYEQVQQKSLDYPNLKIVRPMLEHRFKYDKSGNTTILLVRGQIREARISSSSGSVSGSIKQAPERQLNPDRVGPMESMARGLYNLDYPTRPLEGHEGAWQGKIVAKCRLDAPEYQQLEKCYCIRVADSRHMEKGREQSYAIDLLLVVPVSKGKGNSSYRRIGVGIGTADAVRWFVGCRDTQVALV